jgi:hypothetical protein
MLGKPGPVVSGTGTESTERSSAVVYSVLATLATQSKVAPVPTTTVYSTLELTVRSASPPLLEGFLE